MSSTILATSRYEFKMQIRRKAVWITVFLFGLFFVVSMSSVQGVFEDLSAAWLVRDWAFQLQSLMPIAFGCLLADRLPRDRSTRVDELLDTVPASSGGHLVGKFVGATLATLVPILLFYGAGVLYTVFIHNELSVIPYAIFVFTLVNLPGLLFVAGFSISCPAVMWVPLYQFLFVGYWFWGNYLPPDGRIPTLNGTILSPTGYSVGIIVTPEIEGLWTDFSAEAWQGIASIVLLLVLGSLALYAAHLYMNWQRARQ